ncbi:MAG: PD-(D/E)XK nuclease family protein [Selenomonadales bacterium]|nr:PD-(D/E)XK nuclease family protein [Selenomonadales bacterium]
MEVLTFSRIKARKNCPMAEHIRYDLELVPRNKKKSFGLGSAVHLGLETDDIDKAVGYFDGVFPDSQEEANELEIQRATVRAMLTGYFNRFGKWGEETIRELSFDIPIRNPKTRAVSRSFRLQGKIDAITVIDGKPWLVEYKTASQINKGYFDRVSLDEQITLYMYAYRETFGVKPEGVIYRVLKKPTIRQTKKESLEQFCNRLEQDYVDRPDFYFFEQKYYRSENDLKQFEKELWAFTQQYLYEKRNDINCKNASRCLDFGQCEYMPICLGEADLELDYVKKEKHEELRA